MTSVVFRRNYLMFNIRHQVVRKLQWIPETVLQKQTLAWISIGALTHSAVAVDLSLTVLATRGR